MGKSIALGAMAVALVLALVLGGLAAWRFLRAPAMPPVADVTPRTPVLPAPQGGLSVYHLGHSLVGRDMPAMLEQLARAAGYQAHDHALQLGWGASLRAHYRPDVAVPGFEAENATPRFRPAREALAEGAHDAVILTEMVELRDAILWHDGPAYLHRWVQAVRDGRPDARVYLYETWHDRTDRESWLARLDDDPQALWQGRLLAPVWADAQAGPVHVIPAGRVLAAFTRALDQAGGLPGMADETALFARQDDGSLDPIHLNDLGHYLVALTHFAVLYHRAPNGLPHELTRADGSPADAPSPEAAALMQRVVWEVVSALPVTGLPTTGLPQEAAP